MKYFLSGLLMGICDLIPGISGGTVAFLLGIYGELIDSLSSVGTCFFKRQKEQGFPLFFLMGGMGTALLLFSHFVHFLLAVYREPLFACFCGLILASTLICMKDIKRIRWFFVLLGFTLSLCLPQGQANITTHGPMTLVIAGYCSISAMLLPGISGSYVLHLFGAYEAAITALATIWVTPLKSLQLLGFLLIGILGGAVTFTRAIRALLERHHDLTLSLLSGFMMGSVKMILPETATLSSGVCCLLGIAVVFFIKRWGTPKVLPTLSDKALPFRRS